MKFDKINLDIFNLFMDHKSLTSTDIAKLIFKPQNRDEVIAKNSLIDYRLKKFVNDKIIRVSKINNIRHYSLNNDIATVGESKLVINKKEVNLGHTLIIDLEDNGYLIKFLEQEEINV